MPSPSIDSAGWTIIVPVKHTTIAKTRLSGFTSEVRGAIAVAFALDVVTAALGSTAVGEVVVVTNDLSTERFVALGAIVVEDEPDAGLNPALVHAGQHARRRHPGGAIAALSSDLPAIRSVDITRAVDAATSRRWFVADAHGVGTTMLAARPGEVWSPRFGHHSRAAHRADGVEEVVVDGLERLRRDVDTPVDLWDAARLGLGIHTQATLAAAGWSG